MNKLLYQVFYKLHFFFPDYFQRAKTSENLSKNTVETSLIESNELLLHTQLKARLPRLQSPGLLCLFNHKQKYNHQNFFFLT